MRDGIKGGPVGRQVPFANIFNQAGVKFNISPWLFASFASQESSFDPKVVSDDGGYGLFQITSMKLENWDDPLTNTNCAGENYIKPAYDYWVGQGMQGDDLIRCTGASFNGGLGGAQAGHARGDVDLYTTNNYGARLVATFHSLIGD